MSADHILIVDDLPQNIQIVASMLKKEGYQLSFASSGPLALKLVQDKPFDLILLDLHMPGMDGFAVCRALKADSQTARIPVIFLTANASTQQAVQGFELGAVDYITKPVEPMELRARVRTHLELKKARDQILAQNAHLHLLNRSKSELLQIVSHDLRTPLTVLISGLEFLQKHLGDLPERLQRRLENMWLAATRMESMIHQFLRRETILLGRRQPEISTFCVASVIDQVLNQHRDWAQHKAIVFELNGPAKLQVESDCGAFEQMLDNLISNALKYSPPRGKVFVRWAGLESGEWQLEIEDQGPGFSREEKQNLFEQQGPRSAAPTSGESSIGLGLTIVKKMLGLLEGDISCLSESPAGAHFRIRLPERLPTKSETQPLP